MKILSKAWISPGGTAHFRWSPRITDEPTIGVVVIRDEGIGKNKAYIGIARGFDETFDAKEIADKGGRIYKRQLQELIDMIGEEAD